MARNPNATTIWIQRATVARLVNHMHRGQTYDGYIQELLDLADQVSAPTITTSTRNDKKASAP